MSWVFLVDLAPLLVSPLIPALMTRRIGRYRAQLSLMATDLRRLRHMLSCLLPEIRRVRNSERLRLVVEVDPVDL